MDFNLKRYEATRRDNPAKARTTHKGTEEQHLRNSFVPSRLNSFCAAGSSGGPYVDLLALKLDLAVQQSKQRPIAAYADVKAGSKSRAALTNNDRPRRNRFAAVALYATVLRIAIATITR